MSIYKIFVLYACLLVCRCFDGTSTSRTTINSSTINTHTSKKSHQVKWRNDDDAQRCARTLIAKAVREANKIDRFGWIGGLLPIHCTLYGGFEKLLTAHRDMVCVRSPVFANLVIFNAISIDSWTNHDYIDWFNLSLDYSYMDFDYSYLNLNVSTNIDVDGERERELRCTNLKFPISRLQFYLTLYSVLLISHRLGCKIATCWSPNNTVQMSLKSKILS